MKPDEISPEILIAYQQVLARYITELKRFGVIGEPADFFAQINRAAPADLRARMRLIRPRWFSAEDECHFSDLLWATCCFSQWLQLSGKGELAALCWTVHSEFIRFRNQRDNSMKATGNFHGKKAAGKPKPSLKNRVRARVLLAIKKQPDLSLKELIAVWRTSPPDGLRMIEMRDDKIVFSNEDVSNWVASLAGLKKVFGEAKGG